MDLRVTGTVDHPLPDGRDAQVAVPVPLERELVGTTGVKVSRARSLEPEYLKIAPGPESTGVCGVEDSQIGVVVLHFEVIEGMSAQFAVSGCRLLLRRRSPEVAVVNPQAGREACLEVGPVVLVERTLKPADQVSCI